MNLYFDNAATSHPKPEEVYQACDQALRAGGNPGRGAHSLSFAAATLQFESRHEIAQYLGIQDSSRLIFTSGCTASINLVLNGMVGAGRLKAGDTVLTSAFEHNAVMRPLKALAASLDLNLVVVPALPAAPASTLGARHFAALVDLEQLDALLLLHKPALCIFTRASNVTGQILDLDAVAALASRHGAPLLIDAAQSAGIIQEKLEHEGISFWVASGHKSMLGPPGIGLLYIGGGEVLDPPFRGGTGSRSESFSMPEALPDRLEPGSPAVHLASGVAAGLRYLQSLPNGFDSARQHENILSLRFLHGLAVINQAAINSTSADAARGIIELVGRPGWNLNLPAEAQRQLVEDYLPVFSLRFVSSAGAKIDESKVIRKLTPDKVAQYLDDNFGMATRPGLHCSLLAHQTLGTVDQGLLRVSFGHGNTEDEVDSLLAALELAWDLVH
ncbi:aminotransferase class V-fold PLP-dependent enzyme [bacterium]|nr:aminotransferase class V-fold PLP-dependent enzyme [bacterium]